MFDIALSRCHMPFVICLANKSNIGQGGIQQLRRQNFLRGQVLNTERGQKQTFFDPIPPSSCLCS